MSDKGARCVARGGGAWPSKRGAFTLRDDGGFRPGAARMTIAAGCRINEFGCRTLLFGHGHRQAHGHDQRDAKICGSEGCL